LGAIEKTSRCPVKIQRQQHEGANVNVEADSYSLDPARGYLNKKNSHESETKPACNHKNKGMQQKERPQHLTTNAFDFQVRD